MIFRYFTIWILYLVIFHYISSKIFSLPFLTFIVLFNGLYLSYINPKKYYIDFNDKTIIIDGYKKILLDIFCHICPFLFIYKIYGIETFFNNWKIIPSLLLILLYNYIYNPSIIYHININEFIILCISSILSYYLLTFIIFSIKFN
jgi:hypothetical protein